MTTVSTIIRDAYRENNLVAINETLSGSQSAEGLRLLQRMVSSVYGFEAGEELVTIAVGDEGVEHLDDSRRWEEADDLLIPVNTRLLLNLSTAASAYLPPSPRDGARFEIVDGAGNLSSNAFTVFGNGNKVGTSDSVTFSTDGETAAYLYRGDVGSWKKILPLAVSDDFPFPAEFDDYFVIGLAIRLNPRNEVSVDEQSLAIFRNLGKRIRAKYRQVREVRSELALLSRPDFGRLIFRDDGRDFEQGLYFNLDM